MTSLFVPGFGATAGLYRSGLPAGWEALDLPSYRTTHGELPAYRRWLTTELDRRSPPFVLAGHSMGGALAVLAALDRPGLVQRLVLVSPAGLPLERRMTASALTFAGQVARRRYPARELLRIVARTAAAPHTALRLAGAAHDLDLAAELEEAGARRIPCTVVGCSGDRLTTPEHCRRIAALLGAGYREIDAPAGHIWLIADPSRLRLELAG